MCVCALIASSNYISVKGDQQAGISKERQQENRNCKDVGRSFSEGCRQEEISEGRWSSVGGNLGSGSAEKEVRMSAGCLWDFGSYLNGPTISSAANLPLWSSHMSGGDDSPYDSLKVNRKEEEEESLRTLSEVVEMGVCRYSIKQLHLCENPYRFASRLKSELFSRTKAQKAIQNALSSNPKPNWRGYSSMAV